MSFGEFILTSDVIRHSDLLGVDLSNRMKPSILDFLVTLAWPQLITKLIVEPVENSKS